MTRNGNVNRYWPFGRDPLTGDRLSQGEHHNNNNSKRCRMREQSEQPFGMADALCNCVAAMMIRSRRFLLLT